MTKDELLIGFEYSHLQDSWVNPLSEALDGITAEEALWRPGPRLKGIWDIVLHVAVWNENIVERIEKGQPVRPQEGPWPPPPDAPNEAAWERAKERLWDSLASMRKLISTAPLERIEKSPYGVGDLICRFIHIAYHIGQITKLRELSSGSPPKG